MRFASLGSGSRGNATLISQGKPQFWWIVVFLLVKLKNVCAVLV